MRRIPLGFLAAAIACSGGGDSGPKPASISAGGNAFTGTVGAALTTAPTFTVLDAKGAALSGVGFSVAVTTGGGTVAGAPSKTSSGATSVGTWTLGQAAGANSLTITVSGVPPVVITATGTPDVPAAVSVSSGNNQSAVAAGTLASTVNFKVADRFGNGVPNQPVSFVIVAGAGSLTGNSATTTDNNGLATSPAWTLGKSVVPQQLRATSGNFSATASATVTTSYALDIRFFGAAVDPSIQAAFTSAAARITGLVTGAMTPVNLVNFDVTPCGITGVGNLNEVVPGLIVYAQVAPIDGVGNILGSSGPCFVRTSNGLSLIAIMNFDVADLQNLLTRNLLGNVVLHEMMHAVGFGTLWSSKALVANSSTINTSFIGTNAIAGCQFHNGGANCTGGVPLEACGGSGTANVHWREPINCTATGGNESAAGFGFHSELMTGYLASTDLVTPLSRMTIGSLADMGYTVNLLAYDSYSATASAVASLLATVREQQGMGGFQIHDNVIEPIGAVDAVGRVTKFQPR